MSLLAVIIASVAITCAGSVHLPAGQDCIVPFGSQRDWSVFWPVVFNEQGSLLESSPVDGVESVVVPQGDSVIVSCGPNYLKNHDRKEFLNVKCQQGGKFQVDNDLELKRSKDLACDLRAVQEIVTEVDGCPSGMTAVKFGLVNPIDSKAYMTGEACYCTKLGKTIFAHVRKGELVSSALEVLKSTVFKGTFPQSRYKVDFMKAFHLDEFNDRLKDTLQITRIPEFGMAQFIDDRFLSNRQLVSTKKLAWNYFVKYDALLNYDLLKQDIDDLEANVDIYTGSHGTASLKNSEGKRVEIFLDDDRFPIPEVIWTVVREGNKAVGLAVFNDRSLTDEEVQAKTFCESKCKSVSWLKRINNQEQFSSVRDGLVLCCELNAFRKTITEVPPIENVSEMFV